MFSNIFCGDGGVVSLVFFQFLQFFSYQVFISLAGPKVSDNWTTIVHLPYKKRGNYS
jgi:hypothetical protein